MPSARNHPFWIHYLLKLLNSECWSTNSLFITRTLLSLYQVFDCHLIGQSMNPVVSLSFWTTINQQLLFPVLISCFLSQISMITLLSVLDQATLCIYWSKISKIASLSQLTAVAVCHQPIPLSHHFLSKVQINQFVISLIFHQGTSAIPDWFTVMIMSQQVWLCHQPILFSLQLVNRVTV